VSTLLTLPVLHCQIILYLLTRVVLDRSRQRATNWLCSSGVARVGNFVRFTLVSCVHSGQLSLAIPLCTWTAVMGTVGVSVTDLLLCIWYFILQLSWKRSVCTRYAFLLSREAPIRHSSPYQPTSSTGRHSEYWWCLQLLLGKKRGPCYQDCWQYAVKSTLGRVLA